MSALSVLGGLILLLLGICGVGVCASACGEHRPKDPAPVSSIARLPVPGAVRLAFPPRLGAWIAAGELRVEPGGSVVCAYQRSGEICRLRFDKATAGRPLRTFGKDLLDVKVPQGWLFLRWIPGGGFMAGMGEAWTVEDDVWVSQGLVGRLSLDTPSRESAADLLKEIPMDQLEAALKAL